MVQKILFVDDEKQILSSLNRVFMDDAFEVFTADSGSKALEILKKVRMDLIVSDQRMPEMNGVEFLKLSKKYSPHAVRIILTGYADINAAISSINEGEVYRYIAKPWNNDELKNTIVTALEFGRLRKENVRLLELTKKQNLELKDLNNNLEAKVEAQTAELRDSFEKLKALNGKLNKSFMSSVTVLSNIVCLKKGAVTLRFKDTARIAISIAKKLDISDKDKIDLKIAALLHDIGLLGINDRLLNKPFDKMTSNERIDYKKHPVLGHVILGEIENLQNAGLIVRHHHERWDGEGYPDNLDGEKIPVCSRVLSVASDYEALMNGTILDSKLTSNEARRFIVENSGKRYEPKVVAIFVDLFSGKGKAAEITEHRVSSKELRAGMVLSKDVFTAKGLLLIHEGVVVNEKHVKNIIHFEKTENIKYGIYVSTKPPDK